MAVLLTEFVQADIESTTEWQSVSRTGQKLLQTLNAPETLSRIEDANHPGRSSSEVQAAFEPSARSLGFESERKGLFEESITGLRPDYYLDLGATGVILEVERGKTTTNNMDLLDFWKCHLCAHAHYLFLLVPRELRHNPKMTPKREYESVRRRLGQFFLPGNYANVRGLHLFGY